MAEIKSNSLDDQHEGSPVVGPSDTTGALDDQHEGQPVVGYEIPTTSDLSISTYDSVTITESISTDIEAAVILVEITVYEEVIITESVSLLLPELQIFSIYDSVGITEDTSLFFTDLFTDVNDSTEITESVLALVTQDQNLLVFDEVSTSEDVSIFFEELFISTVFVAISVTESVGVLFQELVISVAEEVTVAEDIDCGIVAESTTEVSIFDTCSASESVGCEVQPANMLITSYDDSFVRESFPVGVVVNPLAVISYEEVSISEDVSQPDYLSAIEGHEEVEVTESVTLEISSLALSVQDTIYVYAVKDISFSIVRKPSTQDSVLLAESTGIQVSDLPGSVLSTVTLGEQTVAEIILQISTVETLTVSSEVSVSPSALDISTSSSISVGESVVSGGDADESVYDSIGVGESAVARLELLVGVYLTVSISEFIGSENALLVSGSDATGISESVGAVISDLNLVSVEDVTVQGRVSISEGELFGLLFLDVDILVPVIESEILVPEMPVQILTPEIEVEQW